MLDLGQRFTTTINRLRLGVSFEGDVSFIFSCFRRSSGSPGSRIPSIGSIAWKRFASSCLTSSSKVGKFPNRLPKNYTFHLICSVGILTLLLSIKCSWNKSDEKCRSIDAAPQTCYFFFLSFGVSEVSENNQICSCRPKSANVKFICFLSVWTTAGSTTAVWLKKKKISSLMCILARALCLFSPPPVYSRCSRRSDKRRRQIEPLIFSDDKRCWL